ncbi:MAG: hypothetical protein FJX75_24520 [Armatimonadetes bacterium]|nr:hypothetical protein [Armatimonadota bacterium]
MATLARLLTVTALAWCSLARAGSLTPITVTSPNPSPQGTSPSALADGDTHTSDLEPKLLGAEWLIRPAAPTVVSLVAVHHSSSPGRAVPQTIRITFDDGTSLPLSCGADGWSRTRVPQVRTGKLRLRVESTVDGVTAPGGLDEVRIETPGASQTSGPIREVSYDVEPPPDTTPCNPLGHSYMTAYFERGLTDGITDPATRREFSRVAKDFGITALRFPGGSFAYSYPTRREGLAALKAAGLAELSYNLWEPEKWGWCSPEEFLLFCKQAGIVAWYELNPGYWYDSERNVVHQIADFDGRNKPADGSYLDDACRDVAKLAAWCRDNEVEVVWEIGNEDYVYYKPATYARIAAAFMRAIEAAVPGSRFALCCDSYDWGNWRWRDELLPALRSEGVERFDFASTHIYMTGAGTWVDEKIWKPFPWATGADMLDSTQRAWAQLRSWHLPGQRSALDGAGFRDTSIAITEFNVIGPNTVGEEQEHSLGRALGEAMIYPGLIESCAAVFHHDLVRNGPGFGNYFQRLDYYPDHKPGCRYHAQIDGAVMRLMQPHHRGHICFEQDGVVVSRNADGLYVSVCNPTPEARRVTIRLKGVTLADRRPTMQVVQAGSLDAWGYDYVSATARAHVDALSGLTVESPPCSLVAGTVR